MSRLLTGVANVALRAAGSLLGAAGAAHTAWLGAKRDIKIARANFIEEAIYRKLSESPSIGVASVQKILCRMTANKGSWEESGRQGAAMACSRFMADAGPEQLRDLSLAIAVGGGEAGRSFAREAVNVVHASIQCSRVDPSQRAPAMMQGMDGLADQDSSELRARAKFIIHNVLPASFQADGPHDENRENSVAEIARIGRWLLNEQTAGRDLASWAREKVLDKKFPSHVQMKEELFKAWMGMALAHPELASALLAWRPEREGGDYELLVGVLRSQQESVELSLSSAESSIKRKRARAL